MPSKTPNYNLWLYAANETVERFFDFRVNIAGTQQTANFVIIDTILKQLSDEIISVKNTPSAYVAYGEYMTENFYQATVSDYVEAEDGQLIILSLNQDNDGAVTIQINGAATQSVMKYNTQGTLVNLETGDLTKNKPTLCFYNGTAFVCVGAMSASDVHIDGTSGQILAVSENNTIQALPYEVAKPNGIATLDNNGKVLQVANVADKAIIAETADAVKSGSIVTDSFNEDAVAPEAEKVSNQLIIQLGTDKDTEGGDPDGTKEVYTYDGSEPIDIIITPESIGVKNNAVYIYNLTVPASQWTEEDGVYSCVLNCENVTEDTVLSDITLASEDVGNEEAEKASISWNYLETGDGTITLYSTNKAPESDFHIIAREFKGDSFDSSVPTPPAPIEIAVSALTQNGSIEESPAAGEPPISVTPTTEVYVTLDNEVELDESSFTLVPPILNSVSSSENVYTLHITPPPQYQSSLSVSISKSGYTFNPSSLTTTIYNEETGVLPVG